jgi:hypothetical protein
MTSQRGMNLYAATLTEPVRRCNYPALRGRRRNPPSRCGVVPALHHVSFLQARLTTGLFFGVAARLRLPPQGSTKDSPSCGYLAWGRLRFARGNSSVPSDHDCGAAPGCKPGIKHLSQDAKLKPEKGKRLGTRERREEAHDGLAR